MRSFLQRLSYAAALLLSSHLAGQTFGTFTGEVKDSSGAAVAAAKVTVRNTATNGMRVVTTNEEGIYTIPALVPGIYDVKAEKTGFKVSARNAVELQALSAAALAC